MIANEQKWDERGTWFQSSLKINCTVITSLICIQRKFTTPDQWASPSRFCLLRFSFFSTTELFTCSKVINTFKRYNSWTEKAGKAWHTSHFLHKTCMAPVTLQFLFQVSAVPATNAGDHESPFGMHTWKKRILAFLGSWGKTWATNEGKEPSPHYACHLILLQVIASCVLAYFASSNTSKESNY